MLFLKPSDFAGIDDDLDAIIKARLIAHISAKRLYAKVMATSSGAPVQDPGVQAADAGNPLPAKPALICPDCAWMSEEGGGHCATHRRGCEGCGRQAVELHEGDYSRTKLTRDGKPIMELWCDQCDPITEDITPVGERFADGQPDPWDLASEELNDTASLPRETPEYWDRDRGEWDAADGKSDIQPFGRTEKR